MTDTPTPPPARATIGVSPDEAHRLAEALRRGRAGANYAAVAALSSAVPAGPAGEGGELDAGLARIQGALVRERDDWGHLKSVRAGFNRVLDVLDEVARRPASPRVPVTAEAGELHVRLVPGECLTDGCVLVDQPHTYAECTAAPRVPVTAEAAGEWTHPVSREHAQNIVSSALLAHTATMSIADQAASDVLDDLASSGATVVYRVTDPSPASPAKSTTPGAGTTTYAVSRVASIRETYLVEADTGFSALEAVYRGLVSPQDSEDLGADDYEVTLVRDANPDASPPGAAAPAEDGEDPRLDVLADALEAAYRAGRAGVEGEFSDDEVSARDLLAGVDAVSSRVETPAEGGDAARIRRELVDKADEQAHLSVMDPIRRTLTWAIGMVDRVAGPAALATPTEGGDDLDGWLRTFARVVDQTRILSGAERAAVSRVMRQAADRLATPTPAPAPPVVDTEAGELTDWLTKQIGERERKATRSSTEMARAHEAVAAFARDVRDRLTTPAPTTEAGEPLLSGREADRLPVGSVVRWHRDRTDGGLRTKDGGDYGWTPPLDLGDARQYVLVHDATPTTEGEGR